MPGPITLEISRPDAPRPGLRIVARDDTGRAGTGEGFPLPERAKKEDLGAAEEWLGALELEGDPLRHAREAQSALGPDLPVATFALESALLELASLQRELPIWQLLRGGDPEDEERLEEPKVNALLPDGAELPELLAAAEAAIEGGLRTLKLKIGRRDFDEDLERLRLLREQVGPGIALRADANGAWTLAKTPSRLFALHFLGLEFLEQPVPASELADLPASPVAIAADESLADPAQAQRLLANRRAQVWVLKPGALGIRRTILLATEARAEGLEVVITHAADGPLALERARCVARALAPFVLACGLDA